MDTGEVPPSIATAVKHPDNTMEEDIQASSVQQYDVIEDEGGGELLINGGKENTMVENDVDEMSNDREKRLLGNVVDEVVTVECVFKRVVCQVHKIKGKKSVHKTKKWGQIKSGYGWIYSQAVRYTCPIDSCLDRQKPPDRPEF